MMVVLPFAMSSTLTACLMTSNVDDPVQIEYLGKGGDGGTDEQTAAAIEAEYFDQTRASLTYATDEGSATREAADDQTADAPSADGQRLHVTVEAGDTLQKISKRLYGNYSTWVVLQALNRDKLKQPSDLREGLVLDYVSPEQAAKLRRALTRQSETTDVAAANE